MLMPITRGVKVDVGKLEMSAKLDDDIIDITSGTLQGRLHRERFICPGINRECIEFMGKFVTPKAFYVMADKASLKDWKNAIRINGKKIRRYIDSGELDFYNHSELCTGRCKSRVPLKNTFIIDTSSDLSSAHIITAVTPVVSTVSKINEHTYSSLPDHGENVWKYINSTPATSTPPNSTCGKSDEEPADIKPSLEQLNHMMLLNLRPGKDSKTPPTSSTDERDNDDKMFWKAIVELGLIDEFFREIKVRLDVLKSSMVKNFVPTEDAKKASYIVNELGLRHKLDLKLSAHKTDFDKQRQKLDREVEELKKKVSEYERKKDVLKRKSDCYEQLLSKTMKTDDIRSSSFSDDSMSDSQRCSSPSLLQAQMLKAQGTRGGSPLIFSAASSPLISSSVMLKPMDEGNRRSGVLNNSTENSPSASQESCPSQSSDTSSTYSLR